MRIVRGIISALVATMVATSAVAQIRIISREKRDSVANPATLQCKDMHFAKGRTIDFGAIKEDGGLQTRSVTWQNRGTKPISITRITTSCGCVRCSYTHTPVEGGKSGSIEIKYAPEGHPGEIRHRTFIYTDLSADMPTAILDIKGNVIASADRSGDYPHAIGYLLLRSREIRIDNDSGRVQTIRVACMNGGKIPLTPRKDALLSSESISLVAEPQTLQAGEEGDLIIRYTPSKSEEKHPLRLFVENRNLPPRDREVKIIIRTE